MESFFIPFHSHLVQLPHHPELEGTSKRKRHGLVVALRYRELITVEERNLQEEKLYDPAKDPNFQLRSSESGIRNLCSLTSSCHWRKLHRTLAAHTTLEIGQL